jgi:hypothetical protein
MNDDVIPLQTVLVGARQIEVSPVVFMKGDDLTVVMHQAKTLSDWTLCVLDRWPICFFWWCRKPASEAHHIVRREVKRFRMITEAGIGTCRYHHEWLENLPRRKYWKLMKALVPKDFWEIFTYFNPF